MNFGAYRIRHILLSYTRFDYTSYTQDLTKTKWSEKLEENTVNLRLKYFAKVFNNEKELSVFDLISFYFFIQT